MLPQAPSHYPLGQDAGSFAVTGFTLFESRLSHHGPNYEEVAIYALG